MQRRIVLALAAALSFVSCQETTDPEVAGRPAAALTASATGLEEYLAPHTVVRAKGQPQSETIPVGGDKYSLFMEPFVLHVRANAAGSAPATGWIRVDGVQVLGPAELRQRVDEHVLELPITRSSVITVELAGAPGTSVTVSMEAAFQPPPTIVVQSPARGAMVRQGGLTTSPVTISGEACHERFPITHLEINGAEVPVTGDRLCEPFTVVQTSRWGMNVIAGSVENARGRAGTLVQAYLRSPDYFPVATIPQAAGRVPAALVAQLNQTALDDHDPDLDDVASALNQQLASFDVNDQLPNLLADDCRQLLYIGSLDLVAVGYRVAHGTIAVSFQRPTLTAVQGRLTVSWGLTNLALPLTAGVGVEASCPLSAFPYGVSGTVTATSATIQGTGTVAFVGGTPLVTVSSSDVSISGLHLALDLGALDFLEVPLDFVANGIIAAFNNAIENLLADQLVRLFPPVFEDELSQVALAPDDPVSVGGVTLQLATGLDGASFAGPAGSGYARGSGYAQVVPVNPPADHPPSPFGGIRRDGIAPTFSATAVDFGLGVKDDAVNQLLWAAWYGGAFDVADVGALLPGAHLEGISLSLTTHLPPVLMPGATPQAIEFGVGDIEAEATIDPTLLPGGAPGPPIHARLYLSGIVDAMPGYDEAAHRLRAGDLVAQVFVQVAEIDGFLDESALADRIGAAVQAAVQQFLSQAFATFPLPTVDLLHDVTVDRSGSYTRLAGRVSAGP